ncbi:MAG: YfhO family protein [Chloroflexota bacterium]|nr:YfhO family protein [Chloroflexota bacterium]
MTHPVARVLTLARRYRSADLLSVLLLIALTVVVQWSNLTEGTVIGQDSTTMFYPWYAYMGERLRSGDIPAWNPYQFSGTPFAGDPQSGWMYLPAMLLFTLLPLSLAAKAYMFLHLALAGVGAYALARVLRMGATAALLSGISYGFCSLLYERNISFFGWSAVMAWLPFTILFSELALRSGCRLMRGVWWGGSALCLSQILAGWLGQGSYYALLALGGYVAYRTLLDPPDSALGIRARLGMLVLHGSALLLFAFALAAAGVLPRLEYNAVSNLAGGYDGARYQAVIGGWSIRNWARLLNRGNHYYAGGVTFALALLAAFVARRRHATPYFVVLTLAVLVLTGQGPTPLHSLLFLLLPGFSRLHPHHPQVIGLVLYLGPAILAGATWNHLSKRGREAAFLALLPVAAVVIVRALGGSVAGSTLLVVALTGALFAAAVLLPRARGITTALLLLVAFADLFAAGRGLVENRYGKTDLDSLYAPTGAASFLRQKGKEEQFRYLGFAENLNGRQFYYQTQYARPLAKAVISTGRSVPVGLQDIQGYNPVHIARYEQLFTALNRDFLGYRISYVSPQGVRSPLLDLLNVRYVLVPTSRNLRGSSTEWLESTYPTAYADSASQVFERSGTLPRAWIVHSAREAGSGEALKLLSSGGVNPRSTALLEQPPPSLAAVADPSADRAAITSYEAERIELRTSTGAAGMLVMSEVYYPAWKAYVDGLPVPVYVANHLLRAVPIPAGDHAVELRYESTALSAGIALSLLAYLALAALYVAAVRRRLGPARGLASDTGTHGEKSFPDRNLILSIADGKVEARSGVEVAPVRRGVIGALMDRVPASRRAQVLLSLTVAMTCMLYAALFILGRVRSLRLTPTRTLDRLPWLRGATAQLMPDDLERASRTSELGMVNTLLFGLISLGLVGTWILSLRLARPNGVRIRLWWILLPVALFSVPLVLMPAMFSMDVYLYMFYGRIISTYGENPMLLAPIRFAGDPHLDWFPWWKRLPSAYGPVWLMLSGGLSTIAGESRFANIVTYKVAALGLHVLTIIAIWALLRRVRPQLAAWGAIFYGWNPLVLLEVVNGAHNDVMVAAFAVLSLLAAVSSRWLLAVFFLSAAAMVKLTSLLLIPFLVLAWMLDLPDVRAKLRAAVLSAIVVVVSCLALYAPLWAGTALMTNVLKNPAVTRYANSLWDIWIDTISGPANTAARAAVENRVDLIRNAAFAVAFVFLLLWFIRGRREVADGWVWGWFVYSLSLSWIWPWYFVLPIAAAAVLGPSRTAALAGGLTLGGLFFWFGWGAPRLPSTSWLDQYKPVLLFGPPILIAACPPLSRAVERLLGWDVEGTRRDSDRPATREGVGGAV